MQSQIVHALSQMGITPMAQRVAMTSSMIAGRLALFQKNWECISNDPWVINCILGYAIDFAQTPYQQHPPKELTFPHEEELSLDSEVQKMLDKHAIQLIPSNQANKGFHSQLFTVPKKDGGTRPIINLKKLNSFVQTVHFKMESTYMLRDLLKTGDWMTKVDLKDAYFMVPIALHHRRLLRFKWQGQTFQFNCLPFGLSSAPWVFTKTTRPVIATLRTLGLRIIIYIDDILIMAETPTLAREHTAGLIFLLENLGFIINFPKLVLTPTQDLEFLGFTIDSSKLEIRLPGEKIKKVKQEAKKLLNLTEPQALVLSRLLGKLNHTSQAIPPTPLFYRNLQQCLLQALRSGGEEYSATVNLTQDARGELEWWLNHLNRWNGRFLLSREPDLTIETDASTTGWGALCQDVRTGGPWSKTERRMHINCLELLAATLAVKCFAKDKRNIRIHLRMDNTTALNYINKLGGTVSPELNRLTKDLWTWCWRGKSPYMPHT